MVTEFFGADRIVKIPRGAYHVEHALPGDGVLGRFYRTVSPASIPSIKTCIHELAWWEWLQAETGIRGRLRWAYCQSTKTLFLSETEICHVGWDSAKGKDFSTYTVVDDEKIVAERAVGEFKDWFERYVRANAEEQVAEIEFELDFGREVLLAEARRETFMGEIYVTGDGPEDGRDGDVASGGCGGFSDCGVDTQMA